MTAADPKPLVRSLLRTEWDAAATNGVTPDIRTGWRLPSDDAPVVTISNDEESATTETGFAFLGADGPGSRYDGTVQVNAWATRADVPDAADTSNPKQLVRSFRDRVVDVLNDAGPMITTRDDLVVATDAYEYLSVFGSESLEETDPEGGEVTHRYLIPVGYRTTDR